MCSLFHCVPVTTVTKDRCREADPRPGLQCESANLQSLPPPPVPPHMPSWDGVAPLHRASSGQSGCSFLAASTQTDVLKNEISALAGVAQWTELPACELKCCHFAFKVRALAWVPGQVPVSEYAIGNHTSMFLSLSFSLRTPLSKNK